MRCILIALAAMTSPVLASPLQSDPLPLVRLRLGHPIPTGEPVSFLDSTTTNSGGGFASKVHVARPVVGGFDTLIWGSFDDSPASPLLRLSSIGSSLNLQRSLAISRDKFLYTVVGSDPSFPCSQGFTQFGDDVLRCYPGPPPFPGAQVISIEASSAPDTGEALYSLRYNLNQQQERVIYRGDDPSIFFGAGSMVPGYPTAVRRIGPVKFSSRGSHFGCTVTLEGGGPSVAVVDGLAVQNQGFPVQVGHLIDPSAGPQSPRWSRIFNVLQAESGDVWIVGDDDSPAGTNSLVMKNGTVVYREGDVVDGYALGLSVVNITAAPDGHAIVTSFGLMGSTFAIITLRRGELILRPGRPVDIDGSGVPSSAWQLGGHNPTSIAVDEDGTMSVISNVRDGSTGPDVNALIEIPFGFGKTICEAEPNSTGVPSTLSGLGTQRIAAGNTTLIARGLPPLTFGLFVVSRDSGLVPMAGGGSGTLCLGGSIGRYSQNIGMANAAGELALRANLALLPVPMGPASAAPGETLYFQLWHRDTTAQGAATSNFTPAVAVSAR